MSDWISIKDKLPQQNTETLIVWVNRNPVNYQKDIKDKPFTGVAWYYNGKWWWWSPDCKDMLDEYGVCPECYMDEAIEVTHWMPLPEPPKESNNE